MDLTNDLKEFLPPWSDANAAQRRQIILLGVGIYMPVVFTLSIIFLISFLFIGYYIYPILSGKDDDPAIWYWHSDSEKESAQVRASVFLGIYIWCISMIAISFYRVSSTDPGHVPNEFPWRLGDNDSESQSQSGALVEKRKDGDYRHCLKCFKRKPDRCHHCRLCERCVLKMDHHCPWVANCIGYYNYKYFLLLVLYATIGLLMFSGTFWETIVIALNNESVSSGFCLFLLTCYTLACFLAIAITAFFGFHIYLNYNDYTTIEFVEKRRAKGKAKISLYRVSFYETLKSNLGKNPLLWLVPTSFREPEDKGLYFSAVAETDSESGNHTDLSRSLG
eukprot:CAMPEP_0204917642 /NCGR_PEP_ID=MMETSP1397-20131031/15243_1 /ASSEMBLY_ACC=CAM_ASM_000891 /TAXON_ID=49980 /ORGANISM="Climacostomum Climacostomum virens, Strain Stock W-24" /LENGTH=334 /DNA_ID=CAMNT_0052090547 /DNA_START=1030 /DNA_END=2030 /DNA_ORIENTATION=+